MTAPTTPSPRPSSSSTTPGQLEARHRRTVTGIALMVIGILFAVPAFVGQVLLALHPPATPVPAPTFLELVHSFGFPVLLIGAGYNLFSREAFADIVDKVKGFWPGGAT